MVRGRLRNLVNIALVLRVELSMLLRGAVVSACVLGAAIVGTGLADVIAAGRRIVEGQVRGRIVVKIG